MRISPAVAGPASILKESQMVVGKFFPLLSSPDLFVDREFPSHLSRTKMGTWSFLAFGCCGLSTLIFRLRYHRPLFFFSPFGTPSPPSIPARFSCTAPFFTSLWSGGRARCSLAFFAPLSPPSLRVKSIMGETVFFFSFPPPSSSTQRSELTPLL